MTKKKIDKKMLFAAWGCHNKKWHTYQLFDANLRKIFTQVVTFDPQEEYYKHNKKEMNRRFLEVLKREKPDHLFLWIMLDEFYMATLVEIKKIVPRVAITCYNGDDDYKFYNYTMHHFPVIDYFITTQPDYLEVYERFGKKPFFGCGADIHEFRPMNLEKKYDVSFVGTPKNDRIEYMRHLLKNGIKIAVCGAGWEKHPEFNGSHLGEINAEQFVRLINESKINICLSKNYLGGTHILERFFEINACRSFGLTEYAKGYFPTFKEGTDIVTFKDKDELLEKVKYYLGSESARNKIAENAYKKTIKNFSNEDLIRQAFEFAEKDKDRSNGLPVLKSRFVYLKEEDMKLGKKHVINKISDVDYVGFLEPGVTPLKYKEYFQMHALERTGLPICCCDALMNSSLIGDYAYSMLYYLYDLSDKSYFYDNLSIGQLMARKDYFLNNLDKFIDLCHGKPAKFINKENTNFISIPFVRTKKKNKFLFRNTEHKVNGYFNGDLLALRNQGRLIRDPYLYKLAIYSFLVNHQILKYILLNTLPRTKNKYSIAASRFFDKIF